MKNERTLREHLLSEKCSVVAVNRLLRLANEFASLEAFFTAAKGVLEQQWNKLTPGSPRGLGDGFFRCYDAALKWWRAPEGADAAKRQAADPVFSYSEIERVGCFMNQFGKRTISLTEMLSFLTMTADAAKTEGEKAEAK